MTRAPTRPALRWHRGKWRLAPWIIGHLDPDHRIYVEPFGGGASVLLRKPPSYAEVYNDLDGDVVTLFRVLRDPAQAGELLRRLELTPFARAELEAAYAPDEGDPVEVARCLVVRSFQGFGSDGVNRVTAGRTGFRANSNRSGSTPAHDWARYPAALRAVIDRLRGVVIEQRDAVAVMSAHDGPDTVHYVDPPYLASTRSRLDCGVYAHEMSDADHARLLAFLPTLQGQVVLSGYPSALYDDALTGWVRVERAAHADGAQPRTEVLWINRLPASAPTLLDGVAA